ncbi:T-cell surface glycoprotein CD3 gamma chain [Oryzias melastigma]|uniref:T-cell surface glycoprotein CD3 gamma chain n=1 Tax=Oryzias melastigma TaxID=30732 RepID=A0A834F1H8_ORYME|nr:T-cell surface glycoprotein CD3 gamma chain [Oryzias melastigma]
MTFRLLLLLTLAACDNCVEFDMTSIASILVGNLVATAGIGVAVYLVASQTRTSQSPSNKKKRSDKQNLVQNEQSAAESNYQNEASNNRGAPPRPAHKHAPTPGHV